MVAFSVTLFNMLPLPIFDGNRILREIIHWIVGTKYGKKAQKKIKLYFDPEESDYALMEYNITKIIDMEMDLSTHIHPDLIDTVNYIPLDTIQDGFLDTIKMDLESGNIPEAGTQFTVTVEYIVDEKAKLKKGIVLGIGLITTALLSLISSCLTYSWEILPFGFKILPCNHLHHAQNAERNPFSFKNHQVVPFVNSVSFPISNGNFKKLCRNI